MIIAIAVGDKSTADAMVVSLGAHGHVIRRCHYRDELRATLRTYDVDIVIVTAKGIIDGLHDLNYLRLWRKSVGIIVVGDETDIQVRCRVLAVADDYMNTPFHSSELLARAIAISRRLSGFVTNVLRIGSLSLDMGSRSVRWDDTDVRLTPKEYFLLECLMKHSGRGENVSKESLLDHLCQPNDDSADVKGIDVFICKLRRKLSDAGAPVDLIRTVWGRGYMLRQAEPSDVVAVAATHSPAIAVEGFA